MEKLLRIFLLALLFAHSVACKKKSPSAKNYRNLALTEESKQNYQQAIFYYNKAIELEPQNPDLFSSRGWAKKWMGDIDGAIADFSISLQKETTFEKSTHVVFEERGRLYLQKGLLKEAFDDFTKAIEIDSSFSSFYCRAGVRVKLKDFTGLLEDCNAALMLQEREKAAAILEGETITHEWGDPYIYKAIAYYNLGNKSEMCLNYAKYVNCEEDFDNVAEQETYEPMIDSICKIGSRETIKW